MFAKAVLLALCLFAAVDAAIASGWKSPAHSQFNYSFTCVGGASGHISYIRNAPPNQQGELKLWVNGAYLQQDSKVAPLLLGKNIESVAASCDGGTTIIFLRIWSFEQQQEATVTIHVDDSGKVVSAGA